MNKAMRTIAMLMLLLAPCAASVAADEPEGQNAAPLYEAIWDADNGEFVDSRGMHLETKDLGLPGWQPGPVVSREIANPTRLARIVTAAEIDHCEFDLDYSLGPEMLIPHHSKMSNSARLLLVDAQLKINDEEFNSAADRITAALRIARHTRSDHYLLAVRLRIEIVNTASQILLLAPPHSWGEGQSTRLLSAFDEWFEDEDPFGLRADALAEGDNFADWILKCAKNNRGQDRFFDFVDSCVDLSGENLAPDRFTYVGMILLHGGLEPCAEAYRRSVHERVAILDKEDPDAAFSEFMQRVYPPVMEYGPITPAFLPGLTWLHDLELETVERLGHMREALEGVER